MREIIPFIQLIIIQDINLQFIILTLFKEESLFRNALASGIKGYLLNLGEVRIELESPSGERWDFGPEDATATVRGTALDFCLVTAQRRNVADTTLAVDGEIAVDWLRRAQLFAGPPTDPPEASR